MNRFFAATLLALTAAGLGAQTPVVPVVPARQSSPTPLDGIVAIVGDQPITRYDLREKYYAKLQVPGIQPPADSAAEAVMLHDILNDMIEEELIIQKAKELKIDVPDADITPTVDRQVKETRAKFPNDAEFRNALAKASLGTPEEYRRFLMEQYRRQYTLDRAVHKLTADGKIVPVNVTEAEISAEFDRNKDFLPRKPAAVTFKQIVIAPQPTAAAKEVARVKAESLLAQLKSGTDFEKLAKRESMDLRTRETGGDLGWARRNDNSPEFDRWLFGNGPYQPALPPDQLSPVVATPYGYHIIRVDRVNGAEVKAHQILIVPKIDTADIVRTQKLADSVAQLLKSGVPFDTLAKKYHDFPGKEETSLLTPWPRDSLPAAYQKAFLLRKAGDITVFQIPGSAMRPDVPKYVVAQLLTSSEGGEQTLDELRAAVRSELAQRGGMHRYVDSLRKQTYVSVRLDQSGTDDAKPKP
jgi:peptidyl-prolyl cis-trans isomerase SurA